ncbi:MAG TPA: molecular chaperone HtpG [Parachlamydiales bacterium]|nr:molecular chaperone HtpG [Parachlamydiales bacterium]
MRTNNLKIHSENILPIIKKWLYSDREIFLRELVSNASDAIQKMRILGEAGEGAAENDFKISVTTDMEKKTLTISDNGIGMTEHEVETYIAQIAFSGAEEFLAKYKDADKEAIIGHFGLGFYSAYMVSSKVEIETLSYQEGASPVFWSCDGNSTYLLGEGRRTSRGTDIILHLDETNEEFLHEEKLLDLLNRYARFFSTPIELNGVSIQNGDPLWLKAPSSCTDEEYLEFYRKLFPLDQDPIFWIHLNVDYPFKLQGILYFPKIDMNFEPTEKSIQLFCNRVFVSDHCRDILPRYLNMLRGAIDSVDLPLNVSRSTLQVDKSVRQLSAHITKKIADRLTGLYRTEKERFLQLWPDIETVVKIGILNDEKFFEKAKELLVWKKHDGSWTSIPELLEKSEEKKIFYSTEDHRGAAIFDAYRAKGIDILIANTNVDVPLIHYLEEKMVATFQRIDGSLDDCLLDPSREKNMVDETGKSYTSQLADFIGSALKDSEVTVEAKSLAADALPGLLVLDEQQRRARDYFVMQKINAAHLLKKKTLVVNTNNKLVQAIDRLQNEHPEVAQEMAKGVYGLTLLSQREVEPKDFEQVIKQQTEILERLASLIK